MVRVAIRASTPLRATVSTMEARLGIDVCVYFLVAVEAQGALLRPFKSLVTIAAFALDIGMTLNDVTWHYQCLDLRIGSL